MPRFEGVGPLTRTQRSAAAGPPAVLRCGLTALIVVFAGAGCCEDEPAPTGDAAAGDALEPGDADPGWRYTPCPAPRPQAEMALARRLDGSSFCIDRYEAFLLSGSLGDAQQGESDTDLQDNGSTTAVVGSAAGRLPLGGVTWYQALAACRNSGGELCRRADWEAACRGTALLVYPYGDQLEEGRCNDYIAHLASGQGLLPAGALAACVSAWGVYDLSGNAEEWVYDAAPRPGFDEPLDHRYRRGGSYTTNFTALSCVGEELVSRPNDAASDRGFRCCK